MDAGSGCDVNLDTQMFRCLAGHLWSWLSQPAQFWERTVWHSEALRS